jgi:hypothetical protein
MARTAAVTARRRCRSSTPSPTATTSSPSSTSRGGCDPSPLDFEEPGEGEEVSERWPWRSSTRRSPIEELSNKLHGRGSSSSRRSDRFLPGGQHAGMDVKIARKSQDGGLTKSWQKDTDCCKWDGISCTPTGWSLMSYWLLGAFGFT